MMLIKGLSESPCFICGSNQEVRDVKFNDKSFAGALCMKHIAEKTNKKPKAKHKEEAK